ncbi:MAG TPA: hypothetical protein VFE65_08435 [Pseudonocardia sp.]|nr:hypothetical protein [Pseudonocardia sp.]
MTDTEVTPRVAVEFRLDSEDEFMHVPDDDPHFNESVYCSALDSSSKVGCWMRLGNRLNEGYAELSVVMFLTDGRVACAFGRPKIESNDRFDAGGLSISVPEPFVRQDWAFTGELMMLEDPNALRDPQRMMKTAPRVQGEVRWSATGVSPMHGGEPLDPTAKTMYGREFSRGHFNQHVATTGTLRVGEEEWEIDGFGWRDHSWGPRLWQNIHWYRLLTFNCGPGRGGMLLKIADPPEGARRIGALLFDGQYEDVLDWDIVTDWTDTMEPAGWTATVQTPKRQVMFTGKIVTHAPLRNRRDIDGVMVTSRVSEGFTEISWDGYTGYGMTEYIERLDADGIPIGWPL